MEKLKVTKEVAKALKSLLSRPREDYPYDYILRIQATENNWTGGNWEYLRKLSVSQMAQAIYVGYEVDLTPDERLKAMYDERKGAIGDSYSRGFTDGILHTLATLDIKVKGVNLYDH